MESRETIDRVNYSSLGHKQGVTSYPKGSAHLVVSRISEYDSDVKHVRGWKQ